MHPKHADGKTNNVDPDQTATTWVNIVCPGLPVRKLRIITVLHVIVFSCAVWYDGLPVVFRPGVATEDTELARPGSWLLQGESYL